MNAIEHLIETLRFAAKAPRSEWTKFVSGLDTAPRVTIGDGGICAMQLANAARALLRQMLHAHALNEGCLRVLALHFSDALQIEMNNHAPQPLYYIEKD